MEVSLDKVLNVLNEEEEWKTSESDSFKKKKDYEDTLKDIVDIFKGEKEFEYDLYNRSMMRKMLNFIEKAHTTKSDEDEDATTFQMRKRLGSKKLYDQVDTIREILSKEEPTEKEEEIYKNFVDEVEDILYYETRHKKVTSNSSGETSKESLTASVKDVFPVKYEASNGEDYYGLVRPPSGIITWQDASFNKEGPGSKAGRLFSKDFPGLGKKIPLNNDTNKPFTGAKVYSDAVEKSERPRIEVKYDDSTKNKVQEIMSDNGVSINNKGYAKNVNKALGRTSFWKDVKNLF